MDNAVSLVSQSDVAESIAHVVGNDGADKANQLVLAAQKDAGAITVDYKVANAEDYAAGATLINAIRTRIKSLNDTRLEITRPMDAAKERVMAFFRDPISKLEAADEVVSQSMLTWKQGEDKRVEAEQAEANRQAELERQRLEKRAEKAEAGGKTEKAEELRQTAQTVVAPVVQAAATQVAGIGTRKVWKAQVTDKKTLIAAVAAGTVPLDVLDVNESVLNKLASALKANLKYPGVRPYEEESLARRRVG